MIILYQKNVFSIFTYFDFFSSDDTGDVSSLLLYISLFGSMSLLSIGIIVFLIITSVLQKKSKEKNQSVGLAYNLFMMYTQTELLKFDSQIN